MTDPSIKKVFRTAVTLTLFAVAGTALLSQTFKWTKPRIEENRRQTLLRSLHQLVPGDTHDNDLLADQIYMLKPAVFGIKKPARIYRAYRNEQPVAVVIEARAPDGYSGPIDMLIGIQPSGKLIGVRVVGHRETPGLGDAIELRKSDWVLGFNGVSLQQPEPSKWRPRRDGGSFDQITSATITSRAVIEAVHTVLEYVTTHRQAFFRQKETG